MVTQLLMLGSQKLAQELLEQEVTDYLGRDYYQRREANKDHSGLLDRRKLHDHFIHFTANLGLDRSYTAVSQKGMLF